MFASARSSFRISPGWMALDDDVLDWFKAQRRFVTRRCSRAHQAPRDPGAPWARSDLEPHLGPLLLVYPCLCLLLTFSIWLVFYRS